MFNDDIDDSNEAQTQSSKKRLNLGIIAGATFGFVGFALVGLATPFILPALRKHCLPYVPATDTQLNNIAKALKKHARGGSFLDIGSGDGRVCRMSANLNLFSQVHGVELNYPLILYSRICSLRSNRSSGLKYFHKDLWTFPLNKYDTLCVFGVESMMVPLEEQIRNTSQKDQVICACRFPFHNLKLFDEIGEGIDTVWVYKL